MIYVVYSLATRRAVSYSSTEPSGIPPELGLYLLLEPYTTLGQYVWDEETLTLVPRPVTPRVTLSRLQFASRLTLSEQVVVEMAKESADPQTRAMLRVLDANLARATEVVLTDPRTVLGAEGVVQVLVGAGVVAPADAAARVAALLAPVVEEAP